MKITYPITLDFTKSMPPIRLCAKQYDNNSRVFEITLLNDGQLFSVGEDVNVCLQLRKADKKIVRINDCEVTDGKIVVNLTKQCLTYPGLAIAEIVLTNQTGDILGSSVFYIEVLESVANPEEDIVSENEGLSPILREVYWENVKNRPFYTDQKYPDIDMSAGYPENAVVTNSQQLQISLDGELNPVCDIHYVKVADFSGTSAEWIVELNDIYINVGIGANVDVQQFIEANTSNNGYTKIQADGICVACLVPLGEDFNLVCATERDNVTYRGYTFPERGIYFFTGSNTDEGVYMGTVKTTSKSEVVKKLDEKFMPDSYAELQAKVAELVAIIQSANAIETTEEATEDEVTEDDV